MSAGKSIARRAFEALMGPYTEKNLLSWLAILAIALVGKWLFLDIFRVPSDSMEPTLHGGAFVSGDRVLVNKWAYGPRLPFSTHRIWHRAAPQRWDVVVLRALPGSGDEQYLVKRIAGLPGETIHIENNTLYINGLPVTPPPELAAALAYTTKIEATPAKIHRSFLEFAKRNEPMSLLNPANPTVQALYKEMARLHPTVQSLDLGALSDDEAATYCEDVEPYALNLVRHMLLQELPFGVSAAPEYSVAPEGCYFLLGDNGPVSNDSRVWGWAPEGYLLGRVFAVAWPLNRIADLSGFTKTWRGCGLLYGIPAAIVALEAIQWFRRRKRKATSSAPAADGPSPE